MSASHVPDHASTPEHARATPSSAVLQRRISIPVLRGAGLLALIAGLAAVLLRVVNLDAYVLNDREADWAFDAWSLYLGRPLPGVEELPTISPLFIVVQAIMFFLFGVTDAIARSGAVLFGLGTLGLLLALRPFVSRWVLAGMLVLGATSPTMVFASRTVDPAIAIGFGAMLVVVALLRAGHAQSEGQRYGWIGLAGIGVASTLASGPEGVTTLLALGLGVLVASIAESGAPGAVRRGVHAIGGTVTGIATFVLAILGSLVIFFTRLFSDIPAMMGVLTTFADWGRMMGSRATPLSQSFFFYALLLYEILAVALAIYAVVTRNAGREDAPNRLSPSLFSVWFLASLMFHSFASGRETEQAVLVALPLVLVGGIGLGRLLERIAWHRFWTSPAGLFPLALLGLVIGAIAIVVAFARANDPGLNTAWSPMFQVLVIALVVILPLAWLLYSQSGGEHGARDLGRSVMLVLVVLLALFTVRSTTQLAYVRADEGHELLARNVPTQGVRGFVGQVERLSRDLSVNTMTAIDNTGSLGLTIAISPEIAPTYQWYFRDFPNVRITGPAGWTADDDIVLSSTPEAMDSAGFVVEQRAHRTRTANAHIDLTAGRLLGNLFDPAEWYPSLRYLLFREMDSAQPPSTVAIGYAFEVSNQINPAMGPFDLFTRNSPGPGSGLGQLSQPSDVATSLEGDEIFVVNAGNQRIERYARDGSFLGVWDATTDPGLALSFANGQGPSGISVDQNGLLYIADTWNHIVLVLDDEGRVVRQLGQRGVLTDIGDGGDPSSETGLFFGPRGVATIDGEIYVTDTGNERVQVFASDGTFLRAFGGFGTGSGQLQEPTAIVAGPDGNLWVADSGNARIVVFSPEGDVVREVPVEMWRGQLGVDRLNDLAFDADGVLYLTTPMGGMLHAWDGETLVEIAETELVRPAGLTVAPDGAVLVVDSAESVVVQVIPELPESFGPQATPGASPEATPQT